MYMNMSQFQKAVGLWKINKNIHHRQIRYKMCKSYLIDGPNFKHLSQELKYNVEMKSLPLHGLSEPEFYGNLVYKFRKIIGKMIFLIISKR